VRAKVRRLGTTALLCCALAVLTALPAAAQSPGGTGLLGEYYDNPDFDAVVEERLDRQIAFDWDEAPPEGIPLSGEGDDFAVVWSGSLLPEFSEEYTIITSSDDGVRVTVDGEELIDNLTTHDQTEDSGEIELEAGVPAEIVIEYFDAGGEAQIFLAWESASQPRQIVPTQRLFPPGAEIAASPTPTPTPVPSPSPTPAGPPDLVLTTTGVSGAVQAGSPLLFTATVVNQGTGPTPPGVPVSLQFSTPALGELAAVELAAVIAPGEAVNLVTPAPGWVAQEGEFAVTAEVDDVNRITESNEDNNAIPQTLLVGANPAAVPAAATGPAESDPSRMMTIGLLALGAVLLLANLFMVLRQRRRIEPEPALPYYDDPPQATQAFDLEGDDYADPRDQHTVSRDYSAASSDKTRWLR
jgi:PA14 domain/CARDB